MSIRFKCPCGQRLKTRDGTEGRNVRCANCLSLLRVPEDGASTYDTIAELPLAQNRDARPAGAPAPPGAAEFTRARILVADSNAEDRRKVVRLLHDHSYVVLEAEDGRKALDLIRAERPAAVVINVKLDIISGFQVIQQLRNTSNILNKDVWDTPVLMTTERANGRDKQYSMSIGAHGYFVKPVDPAQLYRKLDKIAEKHSQQKEMIRPRSG